MGQRHAERLVLASVICVCLLSLVPLAAQQPSLVFPHLASGDGIKIEVNLTNPSSHIEKGYVLFFDDSGKPMSLMIEGAFTSRADFSLPAGGAKKLRIDGAAQSQVGYALVITENAASSLIGNLVFTLNNLFELSVLDSRPTTSARIFVEKSPGSDSGYAVLNRGDQAADILLVVRDQQGVVIGEQVLRVEPGQKASGFLGFVEAPAFIGSLEASSSSPFFILGLRQRPTGSLAALPAAVSAGPIVGSQLLYFLDSGINLATGGFSEVALNTKTVYELTGLTKPVKPALLKIVNNNRNQAVTVHVYFLNDKGKDYFDFLLVLKCGETLVFDPFDFQIPAGGGFRTSNFLFGYGFPPEMSEARFPAAEFGTGRFLVSVLAVANPLDPDNPADDILYPNEVALTVCGMTPRNTGLQPGLSLANLHVFNALPVAFDFLSGNHVSVATGLDGSIFSADATLGSLSAFTRTLVPMPGMAPEKGFMILADPGNADLLKYMEERKGPATGTVVLPSTAVFTWGSAPFTFLPGGR